MCPNGKLGRVFISLGAICLSFLIKANFKNQI